MPDIHTASEPLTAEELAAIRMRDQNAQKPARTWAVEDRRRLLATLDYVIELVRAYLVHMDKREPYADIAADIKQAGIGGPDFTGERHFDGDGCFADIERAAALGTPR